MGWCSLASTVMTTHTPLMLHLYLKSGGDSPLARGKSSASLSVYADGMPTRRECYMSGLERRKMRQVISFLWLKFNMGKLNTQTLRRVLHVIDAPTPKDWVEEE